MRKAAHMSLIDAILLGQDDLANTLSCETDYLSERNDLGQTPLIVSCIYGKIDLLPNMINFGADLNAQDDQGWTALHHACDPPAFCPSAGMGSAQVLLRFGARTDIATLSGQTPLGVALAGSFITHADLLVKTGAELQETDLKHLSGIVDTLRGNPLAAPDFCAKIEGQALLLQGQARAHRAPRRRGVEPGL